MSNDERLKALYRASTLRGADAVRDGDLEQVLSRSGWPDEADTPLDRVAGSALHADVLKVVMALGPDAEALSRDVRDVRQPPVVRRHAAGRSWMALAAGVGAAALLIAGLGRIPGPESGPQLAPSAETILSASFEAPDDTRTDHAPHEAQPIFTGSFDS